MSGRVHARGKQPARAPTRGSRAAPAKRAPARKSTASSPARRPATRTKPAVGRRSASKSSPASSRRTATGERRPASRAGGSSRPRSAGPRARPNARRLPVAIAALIALVILGTSFPAAALLKQHQQLASSSAQLQKLQHQNQLLSEQQAQLNSKAEIQRFARQDYQLVLPGQTLFNVLPPAGHAAPAGTSTTSSPGDPGSQPLVSPANAPNMTPDPGLPQGGTPGSPGTTASGGGSGSGPGISSVGSSPSSSGAASSGSFWHRVTTTLQFWR